jgi:hypothetical protein
VIETLAMAHSLRLESEFFPDAFATVGGLIWRRAKGHRMGLGVKNTYFGAHIAPAHARVRR